MALKTSRSRLYIKGLFASSFLAVALPSQGVSDDQNLLTGPECALIHQYEEEAANNFSDFFTEMVHQREYCFENGSACQVELQKRTGDFVLVPKQKSAFENEETAAAAAQAVVKVISDIENATGLSAWLSSDGAIENYIWLLFVNDDVVNHDRALYTKAYVTRDEFDVLSINSKRRQSLFEDFLQSQTSCVVSFKFHDDGIIRDAHVWIKTEIEPNLMERCISEEFFNSLGLSEGVSGPSIFDNKFARKPGSTSLSKFDLLKLKMLYSDEYQPGQNAAKTRSTTNAIIERDCNVER